jgi:hypothetical protein
MRTSPTTTVLCSSIRIAGDSTSLRVRVRVARSRVAASQPRGQHYAIYGCPGASPYNALNLAYWAAPSTDRPGDLGLGLDRLHQQARP